jgi:hypothetical protein
MKNLGQYLILLAGVMSLPLWAGQAQLVDGAMLKELLKKDQPCCVIDARDEGRRKQNPIPFSVTYQKGIKVAGAYAVVVGDRDAQALTVAQAVAKNSAADVYAVKGGYITWQEAKGNAVDANTLTPQNFTIPHNTCEQGKALQEFK